VRIGAPVLSASRHNFLTSCSYSTPSLSSPSLRSRHPWQVLEGPVHGQMAPFSDTPAYPAIAPCSYKLAHISPSLLTHPLIHLLSRSFIHLSLYLFYPITPLPPPTTMARGTRSSTKTARPAAPVMSNAAKVKAGITPAKPRSKRMTKDATIRELEARIAQLENPDDLHPSKEPLVSDPCSSYTRA